MSHKQPDTSAESSFSHLSTASLIGSLRMLAARPADEQSADDYADSQLQISEMIRELASREAVPPEFRQKDLGPSDDIEYTERRRRQRQPPRRSPDAKPQATRIMYVECKSGRNDRGRARICRVRFSKSGRTIYVGGLILESCRGAGVAGNYVDANNGFEYWVSGPKKKGGDRHWAGGGEVRIEADVVDEYWREIRGCEPPPNPFIA